MRLFLLGVVMAVGLTPRVCRAQLRSVVNETPAWAEAGGSHSTALDEWEEALAAGITDSETWSAIGERLYAAAHYRECIAAFEQSLVQRNRQSLNDARFIADAYAKLGNTKQASRWRATARGIAVPSRHHVQLVV